MEQKERDVARYLQGPLSDGTKGRRGEVKGKRGDGPAKPGLKNAWAIKSNRQGARSALVS